MECKNEFKIQKFHSTYKIENFKVFTRDQARKLVYPTQFH